MRNRFWGFAVLGGLWIAQASALTADGQTVPYAGIFGVYELSDSTRKADDGHGFQATIGYPLTERGSVELSFSGLQRDRNLDGRSDFKNLISLDYLHDFGYQTLRPEWSFSFKPYLIGGLAGVQEDVLGSKKLHPGIDAGAGVLVPLHFGSWDWGWAVRTEVKALGQYNGKDTQPADREILVDYHVQVGLQIPLSTVTHRRSTPAPAAPDCSVTVVDPVSGRSDCVADSDRDGVADGIDQCPNTPDGTKVDEKGCPIENGGDADGDGVLDGDDLCANTAPGLTVDAKGCAVEQTLVLQTVTFETDSAVLTGQAVLTLDQIVQAMSGQPNIRFEIAGHTDNVGSAAYNQILSQQRAEAVLQYLVGKGIDASRLSAKGYGETQPIAPNTTPAGRESNRRVEFKVILQ